MAVERRRQPLQPLKVEIPQDDSPASDGLG